MTFDSWFFFSTVAVAILLLFSLSAPSMRAAAMLAVSYIFYASWDWRFVPLIVLMSGLAYGFALALDRVRGKPWQGRLLAAAILTVILPLLLFKYLDFIVINLGALIGLLIEVRPRPFSLVLPVGISFFTFHALSYLIDVSRGDLPVKRDAIRVALYIAFFPHMIAGPIVRPRDFFPQVEHGWRLPEPADVAFATTRFLWGLFKKLFIADRLVVSIIDPVFAQPELASPAILVLAVVAFGVMIYADFSGYSDMAISTASLLGIRFRENFRAPYTAVSIRDFWQRWHVSLSTWIRDYIYIPLGGNRSESWARRQVNLIGAMTLCGMWHGASWAFVLWGLMHGLALALGRVGASVLPDTSWSRGLGWLATTLVVYVGWALFRSADLESFGVFLHALFTSQQPGVVPPMLLAFLGLVSMIVYIEQLAIRLFEAHPELLPKVWSSTFFQILLGLSIAGLLLFINYPELGSRNFVYFQF